MYVKFGNYRNRFSLINYTDRYFEKKYGDEYYSSSPKELNMGWFDTIIISVVGDLQKICDATINKWWFDSRPRKMKVRIDRWDVWNADHTIANVVYPLLIQLSKDKNGVPLVDDEDVPEYIRSWKAEPKENEWDLDSNAEARWEWVLNEMIWTFKQLAKDDKGEDQFYSGEIDHKFVKDKDTGFYQMEYGPNHTFKVDKEAQKAHFDRIKRGLNLFARYYMSLWT